MVAEVAAGVPGTDGGGFRAALGRQWRLVPVGLLASFGLCVLASFAVPAAREVTARVLLVPARSADNLGANPYLALGGLEPAVSVLAKAMSAPDATRSLAGVGAAGTIDIAPDAGTNGPVLLVSVQGTSSATALRTLDLVLAQAPQTLDQLQRNVGVKADGPQETNSCRADRRRGGRGGDDVRHRPARQARDALRRRRPDRGRWHGGLPARL